MGRVRACPLIDRTSHTIEQVAIHSISNNCADATRRRRMELPSATLLPRRYVDEELQRVPARWFARRAQLERPAPDGSMVERHERTTLFGGCRESRFERPAWLFREGSTSSLPESSSTGGAQLTAYVLPDGSLYLDGANGDQRRTRRLVIAHELEPRIWRGSQAASRWYHQWRSGGREALVGAARRGRRVPTVRRACRSCR